MTGDDEGRKHIEVLKETIDRNRDLEWDTYREQYEFTLVSDGEVRLSMLDEESADSPVETEVDHVVELDKGTAVDCSCHIAQRPFGRESCRHMRAVDSHPQL